MEGGTEVRVMAVWVVKISKGVTKLERVLLKNPHTQKK